MIYDKNTILGNPRAIRLAMLSSGSGSFSVTPEPYVSLVLSIARRMALGLPRMIYANIPYHIDSTTSLTT